MGAAAVGCNVSFDKAGLVVVVEISFELERSTANPTTALLAAAKAAETGAETVGSTGVANTGGGGTA